MRLRAKKSHARLSYLFVAPLPRARKNWNPRLDSLIEQRHFSTARVTFENCGNVTPRRFHLPLWISQFDFSAIKRSGNHGYHPPTPLVRASSVTDRKGLFPIFRPKAIIPISTKKYPIQCVLVQNCRTEIMRPGLSAKSWHVIECVADLFGNFSSYDFDSCFIYLRFGFPTIIYQLLPNIKETIA